MEGHGHEHGNWPVGLRFHPNEEEIITYFLERKMRGLDFPDHTIQVQDVVDVCMYEPWDLPERSRMPAEDRVWYFFNAPVSKYANGKRKNRATKSGFWKVTGRERAIRDKLGKEIGFKKNLVFHKGRFPNGKKTDWVIHEYHSLKAASFPKEFVLFRLKRKSGVMPDSGDLATENTNTQINQDPHQELLPGNNTLSSLQSTVQPEQGISDSNVFVDKVELSEGWCNNECSSSLNDYLLKTSELEDVFVNKGELSDEQMNALVNSLSADNLLQRRNASVEIFERRKMVPLRRSSKFRSHETSPPRRSSKFDSAPATSLLPVFLFKLLVSLVLIIFVIRELVYRH